jgi:hypothetical protein
MSEGGLSIHKVGKELGAGGGKQRGQVLSLEGLSLGNNILILFQKRSALYVLT